MKSISILVFSMLALVACRNSSQTDEINVTVDSLTQNGTLTEEPEMGEGLPVYYNMNLTVDMTSFFETGGVVYRPELLNPVEKVKEYISSTQKSVNMGVYAVDLAYSRAFEQYQKAANFFSAMYKLSGELGIPEEFFYSSADRFERNLSNKDSLYSIANDIYQTTDKYLRDNDRGNAAGLIVFGGWVEAIYLASSLFDPNKEEAIEYLERIAEQKYSLNNLINQLAPYRKDASVSSAINLLNQLKPVFEAFIVDRNNMATTLKGLKAINEKITAIRQEIVS